MIKHDFQLKLGMPHDTLPLSQYFTLVIILSLISFFVLLTMLTLLRMVLSLSLPSKTEFLCFYLYFSLADLINLNFSVLLTLSSPIVALNEGVFEKVIESFDSTSNELVTADY